MKKIDQSGPLYAQYYLIEHEEEYGQMILGYLTEMDCIPTEWGMERKVFDLELLIEKHRINGNRQRPSAYPYVACVMLDTEYNRLTVTFVTKSMFNDSCLEN